MSPLFWLGGILLISLLIPSLFPVYFREDDVVYLNWARSHGWLDCFKPSQAILFGMFRPVQNLTWWCLYRFAGINPAPYHVAIVFTYLASLAAFVAFVRTAVSTRAALVSLTAYAILFYFLTYIIFWFSDLTYTLELMFAHAALWLFALSLKHKTRRHLAGAVVLFIAAVAAKEPAALIVPLVCAQLIAMQWPHVNPALRRRSILAAGLMLAAGLAWILLNSSLQSRQGIPLDQGAAAIIAFVLARWSYYAGILTTVPAILLWAAVFFWLSRAKRLLESPGGSRILWISITLSCAAALLLKMAPSVALLVLLLAFPLMVLSREPVGLGAVWAAPALLGIMTLDYTVRTYLVEASFGLALIAGTAMLPLVDHLSPGLARLARRHLKGALLLVLGGGLAVAALMGPLVLRKLHALTLLSANRQNFAGAISYVVQHQSELPAPLIIIDYGDMGLVYERDLIRLPDEEKAMRQKTMTSQSLDLFLSPSALPVRNLDWWQAHPEAPAAALLTMNRHEEAFLDGQPIAKSLLKEWTRGETRLRLYTLSRESITPSSHRLP
jgi:hypothetical protein